jgi:hypothetical protein
MNYHSKILHSHEIELLKKHFEVMTFKHDFQMVFENQIPQVAIVLLQGTIHLKARKKTIKILDPGILVGAYHLLNDHPVVFGCEICAQSEVILIQKSELLKIKGLDASFDLVRNIVCF